MPVKSAGEILAGEITSAVDALKTCITPIFDVNERNEAELLGSAVLIELAGSIFLCTAKHVIDGNAKSTLYIDGLSKLETLTGDFYSSAEHDMAVLKLTTAQIKALQKYVALPSDKIANQIQAPACKYAEFVGFPETKNRKMYRRNEIKRHIQSIGGIVIEITSAKVRVSFKKKQNIDAKSRKRVTAPDPHGMSGGAMFGASVNVATLRGNPDPQLIGIATDWQYSTKQVFGSNIAIAIAIIRDAYRIVIPTRLNPPNIKSGFALTCTSSPN